MNPSKSPASFLPLSPAEFHVLLALTDGDKHGYAIMKEVSHLTGNALRLSAGTLYALLHRLLEQGLAEETRARPAPELDDERRRYYRLTELGRRVARAEAERLEELLALARSRRLLARLRTT